MDCKKDRAGKVEGAALAATLESLPALDFYKTRQDKSGFLAVPSLNSSIVKFTVPSPLEPLTIATYPQKSPVRHKKNRLKQCECLSRKKKFPAPCYSPIVKFTVPSPLEPLTTVFGKGTCVSAPLWTPENKITIKKMSK